MQPHERNCPGRSKQSKETPLPLLLARILLTLWPQEMGISSESHTGERKGLGWSISWRRRLSPGKKNTHDSADFPERLSGQTAAETRLGH